MSPYPGGDERVRTADPLRAKQVLYQLSYIPPCWEGAEVSLLQDLDPTKNGGPKST